MTSEGQCPDLKVDDVKGRSCVNIGEASGSLGQGEDLTYDGSQLVASSSRTPAAKHGFNDFQSLIDYGVTPWSIQLVLSRLVSLNTLIFTFLILETQWDDVGCVAKDCLSTCG